MPRSISTLLPSASAYAGAARLTTSGAVSGDGRAAVRDHRASASWGDLSLSPEGDLPHGGGRGPLPGDLPASLSRVPHARPGGQRPGVALRDRDQPLPQSLSLRETPAGRAPGRIGRAPRSRSRGPGARGAVRRGPNASRDHGAGASAEATPGVRHAQDPRPRLRSDRPKPRLLGGKRASARLSGAPQDPAEPQRSRACARRRRRKAGIACRSDRTSRGRGPALREPTQHGATAMKRKPQVCVEIEPDLVAAATGDAEPGAARRVEQHIDSCGACRGEYDRYREIEGVVGALRGAPAAAESVARARRGLESRLADLKSRLVSYRVFSSPLGRILIARSEHGVSLVEYLDGGVDLSTSRLRRIAGVELQEDGAEIETLYRELVEYLRGDRTRLEWPLDLRLARSDFHRSVLRATAAVPYGAVTSYAGIAAEIGKPAATRAVAQALRWNPLPIVVPCHRIIGTSGALTGYSGNKVGLKQQLLAVEGIQAIGTRSDSRGARNLLYPYDS